MTRKTRAVGRMTASKLEIQIAETILRLQPKTFIADSFSEECGISPRKQYFIYCTRKSGHTGPHVDAVDKVVW